MIDRRSRLRGVLIGPSIDTSNYRCAPRWLITTGWPRLLTKPRSMPVPRLFSLIRLDRVIILPTCTTRVPLSLLSSSSSSASSVARFWGRGDVWGCWMGGDFDSVDLERSYISFFLFKIFLFFVIDYDNDFPYIYRYFKKSVPLSRFGFRKNWKESLGRREIRKKRNRRGIKEEDVK